MLKSILRQKMLLLSLAGIATLTFSCKEDEVSPTASAATSALILSYEMVPDDLTIEYYGDPAYTYDFAVDWGDGTVDSNITLGNGNLLISHTYASTGRYDVSITGTFPGWNNGETGNTLPGFASAFLREVKQWGNLKYKTLAGAFYGTDDVKISATDVPDFSQLTSLVNCFNQSQNFSADVSNWNTSAVTDLSAAFSFSRNFNADLSNWDVSAVKNMSSAFFASENFSGSISQWDVSQVTDMSVLCQNVENFSDNISNWDVSSVLSFTAAFGSSPSLTNGFNQNISGWNTGSATNMSSMFIGNVFFNQDIGNWNVSSVEKFEFMFSDATSFNQDLSAWNTAAATSFKSMFNDASAFDFSLGSWNISSAVDMSGMLNNSGVSRNNYNQTLIGWESQANTPSNIVLGAFGRVSSGSGVTARQSLTDTYNWTITGDSQMR